jgi:hypothetical protein
VHFEVSQGHRSANYNIYIQKSLLYTKAICVNKEAELLSSASCIIGRGLPKRLSMILFGIEHCDLAVPNRGAPRLCHASCLSKKGKGAFAGPASGDGLNPGQVAPDNVDIFD